MNIIIIDNFDSFTYNLVEEFEKKECEVTVFRNDVDLNTIDTEIKKSKPKLIVISCGSSLKRAGISVNVIEKYYKRIPVLGIGLGCECIIECFGGRIGKAPEVSFGQQSKIIHDGKTIYQDLDNFNAGRYHSLVAVEVPYSLEVSARTDTDIIMGVRHKEYFVEGIQFNPESILTPKGNLIIQNVINEVKKR